MSPNELQVMYFGLETGSIIQRGRYNKQRKTMKILTKSWMTS